MQTNKLFNPEGNDDTAQRTIIKGNTTGLFNLNNTRYDRAKKMYTVMIGNFRVPEKVSGLGEDSIQYQKDLSAEERRAYDGILSFLIFLDSIQTVNVPNLSAYITAPEINLLLAIQAYQEAIHSQSYATILETVVDANKRNDIYYFWRNDQLLLERNQYIGSLYEDFIVTQSDSSFFTALLANYLLEGLYFYNGFAFFDTLADQLKMRATDRMIAYIRRDELTHVTLFANVIKEIKKEFPGLWDERRVYELFRTAVDQEIQRSHHILGNKIMGINGKNTEVYTKWLANDRLRQIDCAPLYPEVAPEANPYKHLERLQDSAMDKGNFFESTVTNYTQSSSMQGTWDF